MSDLLSDFQHSLAPYNGLQPSDMTPETTIKLFNIAFQYIGRLMVNGQPKQRGRPPKPKPEPLEIVDGNIKLKPWKGTPEEAIALGQLIIERATQAQDEEAWDFDGFMETDGDAGAD